MARGRRRGFVTDALVLGAGRARRGAARRLRERRASGTELADDHPCHSAAKTATTVDAKVGDTVVLSLEANPTTGYEWTFTAGDTFTIQKSEYVPDPNPDQLAGRGGTQVVTLTVTKAGASDLLGTYARSWETPSPGAGPDLTVTIKSVQ